MTELLAILILLGVGLGCFGFAYWMQKDKKRFKDERKNKGTLYVYQDELGEWQLYLDLDILPSKVALLDGINLRVEFLERSQK